MELKDVKKFLMPDLEKWAQENPNETLPGYNNRTRQEFVELIKDETPGGMAFLQGVFNEAYKAWQDHGNGVVGMKND